MTHTSHPLETQPYAADEPPVGVAYYRAGMRFIDDMHASAQHARAGDFAKADRSALAADNALAPLGEESDPNQLRDFIAGVAFATEHYLRQLGVHIHADGPKVPHRPATPTLPQSEDPRSLPAC